MELIPDWHRDAYWDVHGVKEPDASCVEKIARRFPKIARDGI
jgi:hypothetical protein